jgi:xanthine/CO dehydrogenase XdhC/CoxF family maturation factor
MLVLEDGTYLGGISEVAWKGMPCAGRRKQLFKTNSALTTYDTTQEDSHQIGVGLGCNGIIDVLFTPLAVTSTKIPSSCFLR